MILCVTVVAVMVRLPPPAKHGGKNLTQHQIDRIRFLWAEGQQESGGNYGAVNSSSGALGRWQVMPGNLPGWARQCGLAVVSPDYFLSHHAYQNKMVACVLGGYFDKYGARGAASMWYSGQPDWHVTYGDPPVYVYVNDVIRLMADGPASGPGGQGPPGGIMNLPGANPTTSDDWSAHVKVHADHMHTTAMHYNASMQHIKMLMRR